LISPAGGVDDAHASAAINGTMEMTTRM